MAYKIGTCTLTADWTTGGSISAVQGDDIDGNSSAAQMIVSGSLGAYGGSVSVDYQGFNPANPINADPTQENVTATATAGGHTNTVTYQSVDAIDLTGGVSVSIPCDVVWEYVSLGGNPFFNGIVDSPPKLKRRYFLIGNGDATVSASGAGASASETLDVRGVEISPQVVNFASGACRHAIGVVYSEEHPAGAAALSAEASVSASISVDTNVPPGSVIASTKSASDTFVGDTYSVPFASSATGSAGSATISQTNGNYDGLTIGYLNVTTASGSYNAARSYSISGVIRAMEDAYPETLTIGGPLGEFTASSSFSLSDTQLFYNTSAVVSAGSVSDEQDHSANTFADVGMQITQASLEAVGDEPYAQRLMFRGEVCPGLTIAQAASYVIDDMADIGGTLSVTGTATGTRTYDPEKSFSSYRYLRVRLRSVGSASQSAKINILGHFWNLATGADGTYINQDIDLCSPDGASGTALNDPWDTRWPVPTLPSVTSGPFRVGTIVFDSIASGKTIEIDSLTLVRFDPATLDILPTLYHSRYSTPGGGDPVVEPNWPLSQNEERIIGTDEGGTANDFARRFLLGNSDGRQTVEESDLWYTVNNPPSGTTSYNFNHGSLSILAGQINSSSDLPLGWEPWHIGTDPAGGEPRWPGWTATEDLPTPSAFVPDYSGQPEPANPYFYNASVQLATFLYGQGAYYSGGWSFGFDRSIGSIPSQPVFDVIEMCGMAGDVFSHGGGGIGDGSSVSLVCAAILRAQAHGLVFDSETGDPLPATDIQFRQDDATVGTGTSRDDGWYHTAGVSAKPPGGDISVRPVGGDPLSIGTAYTRHRHRGVFVFIASAYLTVMAVDSARQWIYVANGKRLQARRTRNDAKVFESIEHPGVLEWVSLCYDPRSDILFCAGRTGAEGEEDTSTAASVYRSKDGGRSLKEVLTLTGKAFKLERGSELQWLVLAYTDTDGAVQRRMTQNGGSSWGAATAMQTLSGDALTGLVLDLEQDPRRNGIFYLTLGDTDDDGNVTGARYYRSQDSGQRWKSILTLTGKSFKVERSSELQWLVTLREKTEDNTLERHLSKAGGDSWITPLPAMSGDTVLKGKVIDLEQDARANGAFYMTLAIEDEDGNITSSSILRSFDSGVNWSPVDGTALRFGIITGSGDHVVDSDGHWLVMS